MIELLNRNQPPSSIPNLTWPPCESQLEWKNLVNTQVVLDEDKFNVTNILDMIIDLIYWFISLHIEISHKPKESLLHWMQREIGTAHWPLSIWHWSLSIALWHHSLSIAVSLYCSLALVSLSCSFALCCIILPVWCHGGASIYIYIYITIIICVDLHQGLKDGSWAKISVMTPHIMMKL